jgi:hypothetical protein
LSMDWVRSSSSIMRIRAMAWFSVQGVTDSSIFQGFIV